MNQDAPKDEKALSSEILHAPRPSLNIGNGIKRAKAFLGLPGTENVSKAPVPRQTRLIRQRRSSTVFNRKTEQAGLAKAQEDLARTTEGLRTPVPQTIRPRTKTWVEGYICFVVKTQNINIDATRRILNCIHPEGTVTVRLISITDGLNDLSRMLKTFPESGKTLTALGHFCETIRENLILIRELKTWLLLVLGYRIPHSAPELQPVVQRYVRRLQHDDDKIRSWCQTLVRVLSHPNAEDDGDADKSGLNHTTLQSETRQPGEEMVRQMALLGVDDGDRQLKNEREGLQLQQSPHGHGEDDKHTSIEVYEGLRIVLSQ